MRDGSKKEEESQRGFGEREVEVEMVEKEEVEEVKEEDEEKAEGGEKESR